MAVSDGLILDCNYSVTSPWRVSNVYTCTARVVFVGDSRVVTEVSNNHMSGKTNSDVKGITINHQNIGLVPNNLSYFFPNLESVMMENAGVTLVNRDSLRGLTKLRQLYLYWNNIPAINNDLFIDNPNVAYITFDNNRIRNIAPKVFDHLNQLSTLLFRHSDACISEISDNNLEHTVWIIFRMMIYCPPTFDMIEEKLLNGNKLQLKLDAVRTETNQQINELKVKTDELIVERINPLSEAVDEMTRRVDEIPGQIETKIADQINPVNATMIEMMETIKVMEQRIRLLESGRKAAQ